MAMNASQQRDEALSLDLLECLFDYAGSYFRLRNFSEATRRGYLSDQLLFVRYLKADHGVSRVTQVERAHIVDYLSQAERPRPPGRNQRAQARRAQIVLRLSGGSRVHSGQPGA